MHRFYFDVALVAPSGLPSLLAFSDVDHLLFGTDYPYASDAVSTTFTANYDQDERLGVEERRVIDKGAAKLIQRLAGER